MAAMVPEAGLGPMIPAKKIANVTGSVTTAAIQAVLLTIVPMTSARLPTRASPTCPASLSFLVPPKCGDDQRREPAEGGEQRHLRVADHLQADREQRRDDERRPQRAHSGLPGPERLPPRAHGG